MNFVILLKLKMLFSCFSYLYDALNRDVGWLAKLRRAFVLVFADDNPTKAGQVDEVPRRKDSGGDGNQVVKSWNDDVAEGRKPVIIPFSKPRSDRPVAVQHQTPAVVPSRKRKSGILWSFGNIIADLDNDGDPHAHVAPL